MHTNHFSHIRLPGQLDKFRKGIYPLYLAHSIRGFVGSLIGFFIPIFLYKTDFSLPIIFSFYAVTFFFIILFSVLAGGIGNKLGLKHTMIISLPLYLIYLISLMWLEQNHSLVLLYSLAILNAFTSAIYWVPLHSLFARLSSTDNNEKQVSMLLSFRSIGSIIAPILGGLISVFAGFNTLFIIAIFILIIPILILFNSKDIHPHINFSVKDLKIFTKKHARLFITILLDSFGTFSDDIIWPMFVFLILKDTLSVGTVGSLIGLGTIIFTLLVGKIVAKKNFHTIIRISAFLLATIWIIKALATNEKISIYFISFLASMFAIMFSVPLSSHTYRVAKKNKNLDEFIIFKQMVLYFGRLLAVCFAIIVTTQLNLSLLLTGVSYFIISIF